MSETDASKDTRHIILVLGPMQASDKVSEEDSRTNQLRELLREIVNTMPEFSQRGVNYEILSPTNRRENVLVTSILNLIEQAELIVVDLTGERFNTAYEVGIIHALGLPHIFVSADTSPPFYLQNSEVILRLNSIDKFDPQLRTHQELRQRMRDFSSNSDEENFARFSGNGITEFYQGLPIVDIAGPSGLAAGYYANFLRRIFGPNGFLGAKVNADWVSTTGGARSEQRAVLQVGGVIVVRPPSDGLGLPGDDLQKLSHALSELGLERLRVTLQPREADDKRTFGCDLLIDRKTGEFVQPAIVLDMPTTLQALQYAPRVRRLTAQAHGSALGLKRRNRLVQLMVDSFARNIHYQFAVESNSGGNRPYRFVRTGELRKALKDLQVNL